MKEFFSYIIGGAQKFSLRYRMANAILIISALFGVQATIANILLELPIITVYGSAIFGIILFILYYFSRFKNKMEIAVSIALLLAIFFYTPVMWIGNAGSNGGAVYYIFLYGAFIISLIKGKKAWFYIFLLASTSITLLILEHFQLIKIYPYADAMGRISDLAVSFVFVIFGISIIIYIYTQEFYKSTDLLNTKNTKLANSNQQILSQKSEIEAQRDEIETQRDAVVQQKNKIEEIHKSLSESIDYATRLQESILPEKSILKKYLSDFFVLFKPKDKVSGDFYWWTHIENHTIITAADCTGHGVPGAFMSMLGISFLREIVQKEYITHTGIILRKLRKEIIKSLNQKDKIHNQKDGMDMAIISINHETNTIQFSGANNPLYIITNAELNILSKENLSSIKLYDKLNLKNKDSKFLYEIKPDKMPIAIYDKMSRFTTHEIQIKKGDQIYLFSDGFADQFGGERNKKYKYKPFKNLLLENANKSMQEQFDILKSSFTKWKGNNEQVDDLVIIGIKI
jgi:serine phosphatase RsbU (regulator of sigma subunit)